MSSTNRGNSHSGTDFYVTPPEAVHALLDELGIIGYHILEPCAGNGSIVRVLREKFGKTKIIDAVEIRTEESDNLMKAGADAVLISDFKELDLSHPAPSFIITNPPFSSAQEIIEHCFEIAGRDTEIAMLLRLGFLASGERSKFWDDHPLARLYPLKKRPSFGKLVRCRVTCGWKAFYPLGHEYQKQCPECGAKVEITSNDSADYGWFLWSPHRSPLIKPI